MDSTDFLSYCQFVFKDKFKGIVSDPLNLRKETIAIPSEDSKLDIMIGNSGEYYSQTIEKLKEDGVCILLLNGKKRNYNNLRIKEKFSYYRFYSDSDRTFFIGTNRISQYIPDYISDYKVNSKRKWKTVVVYVFHEINENVKFFVQHGIFESSQIDFILVCNGPDKLDLPHFVKYFNRENIGHDFGGWSYAIFHENLLEQYEYFVLINSSVRGPFIPPWSSEKNWVQIFTKFLDYKTKLVGTSLGIDEYLTHIQSMVLVLDKVGLEVGILDGIFEKYPISREKREVIVLKEIGLSQAIMRRGYKIRPILSAYHNTEITPKSVLRSRVHHLNNWYFGTNLHPYEVIFIKDNHNINENKDINLQSRNYNLNFAQSINPTVPLNFNWERYLQLNPDVARQFKDEIMVVKHWLNFGFYEGRRF